MIKVNPYVDKVLKEWCERNLSVVVPKDWFNPINLEELKQSRKESGKVFVYAHGSHNTIFNDHETRWYYRAWHDSLHIKHNLELGGDSELELAVVQEQELLKLGVSPWDAWLVRLDLELHIKHYQQHNKHPEYQGDLIAWYIKQSHGTKISDWLVIPDFGHRV